MDGLFKENGPFQIQQDLTLRYNPHTWQTLGSVLYLDQPVGTGLSFVENPQGYATTQAAVNAALLTFLQKWLSLFPAYRTRPLYLTGESYAGRYIPSFAAFLSAAPRDSITVNLRGIAVGNGWTDPIAQTKSYPTVALGLGIIDNRQV